jgi:hypothetical protein
MNGIVYVLVAWVTASGQAMNLPNGDIRAYHLTAADCELERLRVQRIDNHGLWNFQCVKVNEENASR